MKKIIFFTLGLFSSLAFAQTQDLFSDPLFIKQWALKNNGQIILKNISDLERKKIQGIAGMDINWLDTSAMVSAKNELIVAVLDSGLDTEHPDLKGRIWYNEKLCKNAPNAKILACNGYNFLDMNNNITDDVGHGTHVAGIIAANKNSIGIAGAADPRIKIMPLKVLNAQVNGFVYNGKLITDVIADAMVFAIKNGAEVINLSLGWPKLIDTPKVRQAFAMAEEANVTVIAASGNNNKDLPTFPCAYENVVCVGAVDNRGVLTDFSNHGSKVDMVAPGEYIVSTFPTKLESRVLRIANYEVKRGSSQAAPYVSAAVATLKLLKSSLTNDQVRTYLFKSAKMLPSAGDARFVKYGALDMSGLIALAQAEEESALVHPQIKAITEVRFRASDKHFSFSLPVKNLSTSLFNGTVCLSSESAAIELDQQCFDIKDLAARNSTNVLVSGSIVDVKSDSHLTLVIQINGRVFKTSLTFTRDLNADASLVSASVSGANFDEMAIINGERKLSKMVRVMDKFHRLDYPEYFFLERSRQSATSTVVSLLTKENGSYVIKYITLPLVNRVLSIHRQDLNLDGKLDTFIYALSAKKDELLFFNLDHDLNPLFGKYSKWSMPLSTFEGLPIDGGTEKFEWLKIKHNQLGTIVVPSIFKSYAMPEQDNSKNILERITSAFPHHFYLNPRLDEKTDAMMIDLRVLDSVTVMKKLRADFKLYADQNIIFLKPFPQTDEQSRTGEIHSLAVLDSGAERSFIEIIFNEGTLSFKVLSSMMGIDTALIYPIVSADTGFVTNEALLTSLLNRASAEFLIKDAKGITGPMLLKQDWENPVIGVIGAFQGPQGLNLLVENRSSVSFLAAGGVKSDLPVYRDSSFPGQNFSETLMPVLSQGRPGIFINSTLIYGERLYSMIAEEGKLVRPMSLSIAIPAGCVPLNPETLTEKSTFNYAFLCTDSSKQVSLKFLPMSEL